MTLDAFSQDTFKVYAPGQSCADETETHWHYFVGPVSAWPNRLGNCRHVGAMLHNAQTGLMQALTIRVEVPS